MPIIKSYSEIRTDVHAAECKKPTLHIFDNSIHFYEKKRKKENQVKIFSKTIKQHNQYLTHKYKSQFEHCFNITTIFTRSKNMYSCKFL